MAERQHFRIDLEAMVQVNTLPSEEETQELITQVMSNNTISGTADSEMVKINKQIQDGITMMTGTDLQLGHVLDLLNRKINQLQLDLNAKNQKEGGGSNRRMPINLSGGGALIYCNEELASGTMIDLKITFVPEHVAVRSVARIIKSFPATNDPHGTWKVAVEFTHMNEDDQDRVVRKVLQEQTKQLRERRRAKPKEEE